MSDSGYAKPDESTVDKPLFYGSALVTGLIVVLLLLFPEGGKKLLSTLFSFCTDQLSWSYIWATIICFGIMLWLAFGKYKDVKFGGPDAKVEFSKFSWVAMFFCAGIGTALLAWASKEWHFYYTSPPFGVEAQSAAAAEWAAAYPVFHWGPLGWVIYSILAFPIGYAYWNRREGGLRFSTACSGVIGEKNTKGALGKLIDFLLIFGLFGANATTLGSGTPMLAAAISRALGIEHTFIIDVFVLAVWSVLFTTSVALGLKKGIKNLSNINLWAVFILCGSFFSSVPPPSCSTPLPTAWASFLRISSGWPSTPIPFQEACSRSGGRSSIGPGTGLMRLTWASLSPGFPAAAPSGKPLLRPSSVARPAAPYSS